MKKMGKRLCITLLALIMTLALASSALATPVVTGTKWMVSASNPLAAQAGAKILEQGGNAVDAAFATAAAIGVVEPWFSNILGGGTWGLYYSAKDKSVVAIEGVGPAPTGATPEYYADMDIAPVGVHWANIPGAFDGWIITLERYGTMTLAEVLAPAIELAEEGFPASGDFAFFTRINRDDIIRMPDSARAFLKPDGSTYQLGEIVKLTDLANTYKSLVQAETENAHKGRSEALFAARDYFYKGEIAEKLVRFSEENGGFFTMEDFAKTKAQFREPLTVNYRGFDVYACPPNSQGITVLMALNILEGFDLKEMGPKNPDSYHAIVESTKLAFADRNHYVGDPEFVDIPISTLLSKEYAAKQRQRIDMNGTFEWPIDGGMANTTTLGVVDAEGNAMSVTTSIGMNWVVMGDTGIVINNRMTFFNPFEGDPNQVQPGKKVRHTSNPNMVLKDGKPYLLIACSGVDTQPQAQIQGIVGIIDFGYNPFQAAAAPRLVSQAWPMTTRPHLAANNLGVEAAFDGEITKALEEKGHKIVHSANFGNMSTVILIDPESGALLGGADPRREATVLGW